MMEAARLIQNSGVKPRRTIRVALWSGEEEGLLGSIAYVRAHFGTAEDPKPEWSKLDAHFTVEAAVRDGCAAPPSSVLSSGSPCLRPVLRSFRITGASRARSQPPAAPSEAPTAPPLTTRDYRA